MSVGMSVQARAMAGLPIDHLRNEPLEEPFVPGMWFEANGHRWTRDMTGCWNSRDMYVTDGHIEEFGLTVHKPEQPVVMVKKIVSTQLCKHLMAGDTACLHLPKEFAGKEVRVILESAIANGRVRQAIRKGVEPDLQAQVESLTSRLVEREAEVERLTKILEGIVTLGNRVIDKAEGAGNG